MDRDKLSIYVKSATIGLGALCLGISGANLTLGILDLGFVFILAFSVLVAPRMTLTLPHSNVAISFSDALTLLTFLLYGGPAAVIVAASEMVANCLYLKMRGFRFARLMIPTN